MGINFDPKNLNAAEIFARLDAADGDTDKKIKKSVWDQFADVAGGNNIKKFIEEDNAIAAIERYLQKADEAMKEGIAHFLNNVNEIALYTQLNEFQKKQVPQESKEEAVTTSKTPKNNEEEMTFNTGNAKLDEELASMVKRAKSSPEFIAANKILDEFGTTRDELIGKNRPLAAVKGEITTTKEQRSRALKAKGPNGYTYVQAMAIKRDFEEEAIKQWRNQKKFGDGKIRHSNEGLWVLGVEMVRQAGREARTEEERSAANDMARANTEEIMKRAKFAMPEAEREKYEAALRDIKMLELKYANIKQCYSDLQTDYVKTYQG